MWEEIDLGPALGDDFVSLAEHDGGVWFARLVDERTMIEVRDLTGEQVHQINAPSSPTPPRLFDTPLGLLMVTSDYESFVPKSWLSTDDGVTWAEGAVADRPFDVIGVAAVDGHLLAAGALRPLDQPGMGPFTPGLFRSDDGITWTEVPLDPALFDTTDGYFGPIVDQGDRLVTTTTRDIDGYRMPVMVESLDRGLTWQAAADAGGAPSGLVSAGSTLVGVNSFVAPDERAYPISTNSGRAWDEVDLSRFAPPFQYASVFHLSGGPNALIAFAVEPTTEYCYEHVDECRSGYVPALLLIDADGTVASVDLGMSAARSPSSGLVGTDGSIYVVTYRDDRLVLRSWDADFGPVPTVPDVGSFTPSGPPLVEWGSTLESGETYRFPLGTHCGIDVLGDFNGQHWWIDGAPEAAYDANQSDMMQRLLGEITLVDIDTIEYRLGGELIASYAPRLEEPPGCE